MNQIDYVKPKSKLLDITEKYNSIYDIETFMISALKKDGIEDLKVENQLFLKNVTSEIEN